MKRNSGWLTPEGKFYKCDYWEHLHAATKLAPKNGWDGKGDPQFYLLRKNWIMVKTNGDFIAGDISERQMDKLMKFMAEGDEVYSDKMREELRIWAELQD
jgi:hypothetical protein